MIVCPKCGEAENVVGHEVRGVYDGVLYWACESCGDAWPRGDFYDWARLKEASENHARAHRKAAP